jgi:predicted DNA-binding protein with PD1-like motif
MQLLPLRFGVGVDLRAALDAVLAGHRVSAGFVLNGIGSLSVARIRFAGLPEAAELHGDFEILTLGGSLSAGGPHLHMSVADARGNVIGGHMGPGCIVRTTAEVLVALLPEFDFGREQDPATGYPELTIRPARSNRH